MKSYHAMSMKKMRSRMTIEGAVIGVVPWYLAIVGIRTNSHNVSIDDNDFQLFQK